MKRAILSALSLLCLLTFIYSNHSANETDPVYTLVWSDEFDTDGAPDPTKWHHQTLFPVGDSWFNGELQHYTDEAANSFVESGVLKIVAKKESYMDQGVTKDYTSARLNSKYAFTYGRVEVRAKLPSGAGTWPAIWTLGKNIDENGGFWDATHGTTAWPACGEIDIMEHWGSNQNVVQSAMHTPSSFGGTVNKGDQTIATASTAFHVYGMEWTGDKIVFDVDGVVHYTYEPTVKDSDTWPFDSDQYILLNTAIESNMATVNPTFTEATMEIDYVRVYEAAPAMTTEEYCAATVYHLGLPAEAASAAILTIENVDASSMKVTMTSADSDPIDDLIVNNSTGPITGSPAVSAADTSVPGEVSVTLTWTGTPPSEVELNVLWSKESTAGNWQLIGGGANTTVSFAADCGGSGGGGSMDPVLPTAGPTAPMEDAADVISIYSDSYTDVSNSGYANYGAATFEQVDLGGNNALRYELTAAGGGNFQVIELGGANQIDASGAGVTNFRFDAWFPEAVDGSTSLLVKVVDISGSTTEAALTISTSSTPAMAQGEWLSYDFTLADLASAGIGGTANIQQVVIDVANTPEVYLDNIYFYDDGSGSGGGGSMDPVLPTAGPTAPMEDAADVISIYSDSYTDVSNSGYANYGAATFEQVDLGGNNALRYELTAAGGGNFQVIELGGANQIDASGAGMTNFRFDAWFPEAVDGSTSLLVKVVDISGSVTEAALTVNTSSTPAMAQGEWLTYDFTLADLASAGIGGTSNIQQVVIDVANTPEVYLDNIYFYDDGSGSGGGVTTEEYCAATVYHLGLPAEAASAAILTIENVDASSMKVTMTSADSDPIDDLIVNNSTGPITGSPAVSAADTSVPGEISVTLTWTGTSPSEVELNVLWSKESTAGNWQLIGGGANTTVSFAADCGGTGGGGSMDPILPTAGPTAPMEDAADVISIYSDSYTDVSNSGYANYGAATFEQVDLGGNNALRYELAAVGGGNFQVIELGGANQIDASGAGMTNFRFDAWFPEAVDGSTSLLVKVVDVSGSTTEAVLTINTSSTPAMAQGEWLSYDFTLSDLGSAGIGGTANIQQVVIDVANTPEVYLDNIYFYDDGSGSGGGGSMDPVLPTAGPTAPMEDAADVISIYSDSYTDVSNSGYANYGAATFEQVDLGGNNALRYTLAAVGGGNFQVIELGGANQIDASGAGMTNFRFDAWFPEAVDGSTSLLVKVVDISGSTTEAALTVNTSSTPAMAQGEWLSYDFTLADLASAGIGGTSNIQQVVIDVANAPEVYLDNIYFYDDGSGSGGGGGVTTEEYCATTVYHLGLPAEVASVAILTIENVDASSMKVTMTSADSDPIDDLIVNNSTGPITGSPAVSAADISVPGEISVTLTWTGTPPSEVELNVLWSKESTAGNWQLIGGGENTTVSFAADCGGSGGGGGSMDPVLPTAGPTAPMEDAADVISIYSDSYTDVPNSGYANYGAATFEQVDLGGNNALRYTLAAVGGGNFQIIELGGANQIDASAAGMTNFRFDAWFPEAVDGTSSFLVKVVDISGSTTEASLTINTSSTPAMAQGEWLTYDFTIADLTSAGIGGTANIQQIVFDVANTPEVYIDNIYFYDNGSGSGGGGGGVTTEEYCATTVYHLGLPAEVASAAILTIENVDASSMKVTMTSADSDPIDDLIVNNSTGPITGSPAVSAADTSVPGEVSVTLTWTETPPSEVELNVLWSKVSTAGNWQLIGGGENTTVSFAADCSGGSGGGGGTDPVLPTAGPTAPMEDAADVISIYSDSYTDVSNSGYANYGAATFEQVDLGGNNALRYTLASVEGGNFQIIELGGTNQIDASAAGMTNFRFDAWFPEAVDGSSSLLVKVVDISGSTTEASLTINTSSIPAMAQGEWLTYDFTIADLTSAGIGGTANIQQIVFDVANTPDVYIDNIYFYNSQGTGGGGGGNEEDYCEQTVYNNGNDAETTSAAILTIENVDASSMKVTISSADSDPIDALIVNNATGPITGSPGVSPADDSVPGELSVTLTWTDTPPTDVELNVLWSKVSFEGNWQLGTENITVAFDKSCGGGTGGDPVALPVDFESATATYAFGDFEGGATTVIANPQSGGINTSATVAQTVKGAGEVFAGTTLALDEAIDFGSNTAIKIKVYAPRAGVPLTFKLESSSGDGNDTERVLSNAAANTWEELEFDFADNIRSDYTGITLIWDNGTAGDGSADWTFLVDDIEVAESSGPSSDASLSSLLVDGESVNRFDPETFNYFVLLPEGTATDAIPTVTATSTDAGAMVDITDPTELPGFATVLVTAEDGESTNTYTIEYAIDENLSKDASLSDLQVDGATITGFATDTYQYNVELAETVTTVPTITATATDANATVNVEPAVSLPGTTNVTVTAEDGTTIRNYSIEFTYPEGTEVTYTVSGTITADGNPFSEGIVVMYDIDNINNVSSVSLGSDGTYSIGSITEGSYYIYVSSDNSDFVTTFYGNVSSVLDASAVPAILIMDRNRIANVEMVAKPDPAVEEVVDGAVINFQAQAVNDGNSRIVTGRVSQGASLANVLVILNTINDEYVADAVTDSDGMVSFTGLPTGDYSLVVEVPGVGRVSSEVSAVEGQTADFTGLIDEDGIIVNQVLGLEDKLISETTVYPNPTVERLSIALPKGIQLSNYTLTIVSLSGRLYNAPSEAIDSTINVDVSKLESGVYFIRLNTKDGSVDKRFIKR